MHSPCHDFRETLAGGDVASFSAHAETCAECARFAARLERLERAFGGLPRRVVPAELDGRVVAALEAGERTRRAVGAIGSLARVAVPEHLDRAVAATAAPAPGVHAPDVLRRLVEEELSDPSKARTRRFVGSLERFAAPAELAERVALALGRPAPARSFRSRLLVPAAALALVSTVAAALWFARPTLPTPRRIQWVHATSPEELSPLAASLLAGLSGGASELAARKEAR